MSDDPWLDDLKRRLEESPHIQEMRRDGVAIAEHYSQRGARIPLVRRLAPFGLPAAAIIGGKL